MTVEEATAIVLGCLMADPQRYAATPDLRESLFPDSRSREVYSAVAALGPRGTVSQVVDYLKRAGKLRDAGGSRALEAAAAGADRARFEEALAVLWDRHAREARTGVQKAIGNADRELDADAVVQEAAEIVKNAALLRPGGPSREHVEEMRRFNDALAPVREVKRLGDDFYYAWPRYTVACAVEQVRDYGDGLAAEIDITSQIEGPIHFGRLILASMSSREALIRKLEKRHHGPPWAQMVETLCRDVTRAIRAGEPIEELRPDLDEPDEPIRYTIEGLVPEGKVAILYGDGENLKSTIALGAAVAAAAGRPFPNGFVAPRPIRALYLDWEDDRHTALARLKPIMRGLGLSTDGAPGLLYRRMTQSLDEHAGWLGAEVARLGVDLVVLDSLGAASGPEPETPGTAIRTMMAARRLGASVLAIAHISKADQRSHSGARPFGSVYYRNLARVTCEVRRAEDLPGSGGPVVVGVYPQKHNYGRRPKPSAFRIEFAGGEIRFEAAEITDEPELAGRLATTAQIGYALKRGALTTSELAEEIGKAVETVRRSLNRLVRQGKVIKVPPPEGEKEAKWGLKQLG